MSRSLVQKAKLERGKHDSISAAQSLRSPLVGFLVVGLSGRLRSRCISRPVFALWLPGPRALVLPSKWVLAVQGMTLNGLCVFHSETGTEGGFWAFQDERFIEPTRYSYDGLHILVDGDKLTIYSKDSSKSVVWSGIISLIPYPAFTEDVEGLWIHSDQRGVKRKEWAKFFCDEFPAELVSVAESHL